MYSYIYPIYKKGVVLTDSESYSYVVHLLEEDNQNKQHGEQSGLQAGRTIARSNRQKPNSALHAPLVDLEKNVSYCTNVTKYTTSFANANLNYFKDNYKNLEGSLSKWVRKRRNIAVKVQKVTAD